MSDLWGPVIIGVVSGGGVTGVGAFIKSRADANAIRAGADQTIVQTALSESAADDEHWKAIIATQTEVTKVLLEPLTKKVVDQDAKIAAQDLKIDAQDRKIDALEIEVRSVRRRYRDAREALLEFVRYTARLVRLLEEAGISAPQPPAIPTGINEDT